MLVAVVYTAWQLFPPYYTNFEFEEAIDDVARMAALPPFRSEQEIRDSVMKQAQSLDIPIRSEQVQVERRNGEVYVWGDYSVHVDLPMYPLDLQFHPMSKNKKRRM